MMVLRTMVILAAASLLGGCFEATRSSVAGSCGVFERPPYALRGVTRYDQDVADKFVESGVAGCNWQRPARRPPQLDAQPLPKAQPAAKRRSLVGRLKQRVRSAWPAKPAPAIEPVPVAPAIADPAPIAPPAVPAPRRPIDELLRPLGKAS